MCVCLDCGLVKFMWCPKEVSEILILLNLFENIDTTKEGKVCKQKDLTRKFLKPRDLSYFF